jgi:pimeloyl-ACP methyl ester carboxylesterase
LANGIFAICLRPCKKNNAQKKSFVKEWQQNCPSLFMNTESFSWNGAGIIYHRSGKGPRVMLLHGFGEDAGIWQQQAAHLEQIAEVVVPHLPGSGPGSIPRFDQAFFSIEAMADMTLALLDHLQWQQVILLGHSMGGYISLAFAEKYPDRLKAFGLVHSTAFADSAEKKQTRAKAIDFIAANGSEAFLKTAIPGLFGPDFTAVHPGRIAQLAAAGAAFHPVALIGYYHTMMNRPDRTRVLREAKVPVLFVMGEHDKAVAIADVLQQVSMPECSYVHVLKQSGHMGMWEETETMNAALGEFILANA